MLNSQSPFLLKHLYLLYILPFLFSCSALDPLHTNINIDLKHDLIYKNCGNNTLAASTNSPQQILSTLFDQFLVHSSISKFYQTNIGDEGTAISGLYQCQKGLSQDECKNCISQIPELSRTLCGSQVPSRIHLSGCYMHYKQEGYENSKLEVQHKTCGGEENFGGFIESRERALEGAGECVLDGEGCCDMKLEGIHVLAQCGGELGRCECGECIGYAEEILRSECKNSIAGEVYLDGCYLSYSYSEAGNPGYSSRDYESKRNSSGKLVAIVVGGVALLSFGVMFLYCCRSRSKSDDW